MSPDPCDAREADAPGVAAGGFTLPCRCGAGVAVESLLAQLARSKGVSVEAERVAQGLTRSRS